MNELYENWTLVFDAYQLSHQDSVYIPQKNRDIHQLFENLLSFKQRLM